MIITVPAFAEQVAEAQLMLDEQGLGYDVIDITNKEEISDKDLLFVLRNQGMFFRKKDDDARQSYSAENLYQSLDAFRNAVGKEDLVCKLPYVMRDGVMEAWGDEKWRWMVNGANPSKTAWGKLQTRPNN